MSLAFARFLRASDALLRPRRSWTADRPAVRRILIGAQMGIGNMVMFTPFLRALRAGFPAAHVALAFWKRNGADEVVAGSPWVDEIIHLDTDGLPLRERVAAGARLGRRGWDLVVLRFNGMPEEMLAAAVYGRIPHRVAHVTGPDFASGADHLVTLPARMTAGSHEIDRYLALAEALDLRVLDRAPEMILSEEERSSAGRRLAELGVPAGSSFIAVQPGTSAVQAWKRWPVAHWRELIAKLEPLGLPVVAFGSADERALLEEVCGGTVATNAGGRLTLRETAAALEVAAVLVCTDSGLMHLASAVGTPVVALFGPTNEARTGPYGDRAMVLRTGCSDVPCLDLTGLRPGCRAPECMRRIEPAAVVSAVAAALDVRPAVSSGRGRPRAGPG